MHKEIYEIPEFEVLNIQVESGFAQSQNEGFGQGNGGFEED